MRGLLPDRSARVVAVIATQTAEEAVRRHRTRGPAAVALGRAAAAGLLLATLTKDRERVTLQISGDGPLGRLIVDASASGDVRAFLKHPHEVIAAGGAPRLSLGGALGREGVVSLVRDLGMRDTWSGQTPFVSGEVDEDVQHYLINSEQIDSALGCEVLLGRDAGVAACGGVLLQTLPGSGAEGLLAELRERLKQGWLAELLAQLERPARAEALARAVLAPLGQGLTALDVRPVRFACPCSRERAAASMALMEERDLTEMIAEEEDASVTCEFCRAQYSFSKTELEAIRADARRRAESAS